jgi:hypothetical protein
MLKDKNQEKYNFKKVEKLDPSPPGLRCKVSNPVVIPSDQVRKKNEYYHEPQILNNLMLNDKIEKKKFNLKTQWKII